MPNYKPYHPEQADLLPAHVRDVLGKNHLCFLVHEVMEKLDLGGFEAAYGEAGGESPYHPRLMVKVWLYAFALQVKSTRKLVQRILVRRAAAARKRKPRKRASCARDRVSSWATPGKSRSARTTCIGCGKAKPPSVHPSHAGTKGQAAANEWEDDRCALVKQLLRGCDTVSFRPASSRCF